MTYAQPGHGPSRVPPLQRLTAPLRHKWTLSKGINDLAVSADRTVFVSADAQSELVCVGESGRVLWRRRGGLWSPQIPRAGQVLVQQSDPRRILTLDAASGITTWEARTRDVVKVMWQSRQLCVLHSRSATGGSVRIALSSLPPDISTVWERSVVRDSASRDPGAAVDSSLASDGERLYLLRRGDVQGQGEVWAVDLLTGQDRWRFPVHEVDSPAGLGKWRPQVSASGRLLFRTDTWLVCLNAATGKLLWKLEEGYGQTVQGERVYLAHRSRILVLDLRNGVVLLDRDVGKDLKRRNRSIRLTGRPAVSETHIFALDEPGTIWAFDRETGEPVWDLTPEGTTGFIGNEQPVIDNGRLYVATFSTNPKHPQSLYCFEQADDESQAAGRARVAVPAPGGEAQQTSGPLLFEVLETLERRMLAKRAPYHKPGGPWTFYRCRLANGGGEFLFGEKGRRKTPLGTFGQAILAAASTKDADALLKAFRKALGKRKPAGEGPARRVKTPTVANSFSLVAEDVPELRKLTSLDGSTELLIAWDPDKRRGAFLEKDESYRNAVLELIAGLAVR